MIGLMINNERVLMIVVVRFTMAVNIRTSVAGFVEMLGPRCPVGRCPVLAEVTRPRSRGMWWRCRGGVGRSRSYRLVITSVHRFPRPSTSAET